MPWVRWFKHLGIGLDEQASLKGMWEHAHGKGERAFYAFVSGVLAVSFLPLAWLFRLYRALVMSVLTYGIELWGQVEVGGVAPTAVDRLVMKHLKR